jgi:hypothetical protein
MECIVMNCPQCGAELRVRVAVKQFACGTCGTGLKIECDGGIICLTVPIRDSVQGINQSTAKIASEMALTRLMKEHRAEIEHLEKLTNRAVVGGVIAVGIPAAGEVLRYGVSVTFRIGMVLGVIFAFFTSLALIAAPNSDSSTRVAGFIGMVISVVVVVVSTRSKVRRPNVPALQADPRLKEEIQATKRRIAEIEESIGRHQRTTEQ